ncbi:MAG TPA: hypothetical protein VER03_13340 [Bryobacteraceae bacterium]|nr:hypothetical protein [Bryobacteraceae bacterium]
MTLAHKTLVALAVCSVASFAEPNRDTADQRFRAKYGRSTPAVEAQETAEKASTAYRDATPPSDKIAPNRWAEQRHQVKFGRPTPAEEKRLEAERSNTAYREVTTPPADRWQEGYMGAKYGRTAPKK